MDLEEENSTEAEDRKAEVKTLPCFSDSMLFSTREKEVMSGLEKRQWPQKINRQIPQHPILPVRIQRCTLQCYRVQHVQTRIWQTAKRHYECVQGCVGGTTEHSRSTVSHLLDTYKKLRVAKEAAMKTG